YLGGHLDGCRGRDGGWRSVRRRLKSQIRRMFEKNGANTKGRGGVSLSRHDVNGLERARNQDLKLLFKSERTSNGYRQEHHLPVVRKGCRGCSPLLRRDFSQQFGERGLPCSQRLSVRQGRRCTDGRIHSRRHPLSRPEWRACVQTKRSL